MVAKKTHIGEIVDNKACPECGKKHSCEYCDDWHYCDCGYWWSELDGKTINCESYPPSCEQIQEEKGDDEK